ncbi:sensor histidine kinase [Ornithinimicrobium tianjinense]|uniref:histidine kinase n=1 Tax=Ornithinimicrobium tianjinense TaxID=1195761 RepID=A0A917BX25_9MICO|nr:sensor histidine kinase [Ornithinimicrobium tianjinense]GGF58130.1 two-component sensor histidine kinase [Ornithinimicrobium tianjinense]
MPRPTDDVPDLWRHPWAPDLAVVGALLLWALVSGVVGGFLSVSLGMVMVLPLLWRRRAPLVAALGVALVCLVQVAVMDQPHPADVAVPIAVYSAAAFGTRTESRLVLLLGLLGAGIAALDWRNVYVHPLDQLPQIAFQAFFMAMFLGVAWVLGDVVRRRKAVLARLAEQNAALARDHAQRTRLASQEERAAIAREMHDVVAHSLAVVVVQADGALYAARRALDAPPGIAADRAALERAAQTLETLAETARSSLADTRRLVGVLREEGSGAEFSPLQELAYLDELAQGVRDSGVAVDVVVRGQVDDLPREVDLAAYRVVQESLTNVLKHAGPHATVDVDVLRTPAVLLVRVTDDGAGQASDGDGEGNGILGMSERVEVLGGTVHAGPRTRGGWEVVASLPVEPAPSAGGAA